MDVMKKVLLFLLVIIICFQQSISYNIEIEKKGEEFLDYLLTTTEITNNENLLTIIGKAYESLGLHEIALNLFSHLQSDHNKYTLLNHLIKSTSNNELNSFEKIENHISSLEDGILRIKLYLDLILKYNKLGLKTKVIAIYKKCYNEINLLNDNDDFEDKIFLSIDLSFILNNCGLPKESDKILLEVDKINENSKDPFIKIKIYEYIIYSCIEINDNEKANLYAPRLYDLLMTSPGIMELNYSHLLEAFVGMEKYQYACDLANKIIKFKNGLNSLKGIYSLMAVSKILTCGFLDMQLSQNEFESTEETWIKLLIEKGNIEQAKKISEKLDAETKTTKNRDVYFFYLGEKYLTKSSSRILKLAALNLAYKIKDINKKIALMTEIALDFKKSNETDILLRIMNDLTIITENKNFSFDHGKKDTALVFLKVGFPDKAMQLIETIEDKISQSFDLYKFGAYALTHYNKNLAERALVKLGDDSVYRGLLLSKIASWYLIQGERDISLKLFKKAFDIMKKWDVDSLSFLIDDYTNARIYGRLIVNF